MIPYRGDADPYCHRRTPEDLARIMPEKRKLANPANLKYD